MMESRGTTGDLEWTNESVKSLAGNADPLTVVSDWARNVLFAALDEGLNGPPIDPFKLASLLGLGLRARADVADARIGPVADDIPLPPPGPLARLLPTDVRLVVEYNPTRPRGRLRYSVAHEIAHAMFPDVHQTIRHRTGTGAIPSYAGDDSWQLELLCNVAAAELLMPLEAVAGLIDIDPDINFLMQKRKQFDVSTEALLRRLAHDTSRPLAVVATSRVSDRADASMRIEYVVHSKSWVPQIPAGTILSAQGIFGGITAVGETAQGIEKFGADSLQAQVVGIPAYPGRVFPRVLGLLEPQGAPRASPEGIRYMTGDVTEPQAEGPVVIAHVVSDAAHSWSQKGVAAALRRRFPAAAAAFRAWSIASEDNLTLGNVHSVNIGRARPIFIASMVAQRGYGPTSELRLVYQALAEALHKVAGLAQREGASVHLPRIGAGQAGGRWDLVEEEMDRSLVQTSVPVTVYTPQSRTPKAVEATSN